MSSKFQEDLGSPKQHDNFVPADHLDPAHPMFPVDLESLLEPPRHEKKVLGLKQKNFRIALSITIAIAVTALVTVVGLSFGKSHPPTFGPQGPKSIVTVNVTEIATIMTRFAQLVVPTPVTRTVTVGPAPELDTSPVPTT
ncbi:hypothetical protein BDV96DRAFT_644618 [Lophiotrema nucula]|uniref:Uncharacterized protein n=1 Tax=Lophiotrema nucula TaxID=690887 RepID=A0A6A5ZEN0_9PLEO|nr:hypothetical protein BDV96DRAFT_644618 [Lophiotrema nucula]